MNRSDRIALIARSYANGQANRDNDGSGVVKRALLRRLAVLAALNAIPIVLFCVLLLIAGAVAVVFYSMFQGFSDDKSVGLSDSYGPGISFREQFATDFQTIPYGIPIERGIVGMAIDQRKYREKDKYWLASYNSHMGQDFSRAYSDKSAWYLPYLFSTLKWVVYLVEKRREDPENPANYLYERDTLVNGEYVRTSRTIRKDRADMMDPTYKKNYVPYWQRVVIASLDGKFYVQYTHMSSVRPDLLSTGGFIDRGDSIGIMGSTGNSSGVHLHYEVLYCGENNKFPELRTDTSCEKMNPFGYYAPLNGNFLWFDPKGGAFVVWGTSARMSMAIGESEAMDELKRLYKGFCGNYGLDEESCKKTYPIVRASQGNSDYPPIDDPADAEKTAWKYLAREYGVIEGIPDSNKILQVVTSENLQAAFDWRGVISQLSGKMSHGKYLDSQAAYRIRDAWSSSAADSAAALDEAMDRLLTIARKNWGDMEKSYLEFYGNAGYPEKWNPYVYNLSDKSSIFLDIRKADGTPIRKFTWYWALATYRKL